jgi:hypothetical protein
LRGCDPGEDAPAKRNAWNFQGALLSGLHLAEQEPRLRGCDPGVGASANRQVKISGKISERPGHGAAQPSGAGRVASGCSRNRWLKP